MAQRGTMPSDLLRRLQIQKGTGKGDALWVRFHISTYEEALDMEGTKKKVIPAMIYLSPINSMNSGSLRILSKSVSRFIHS